MDKENINPMNTRRKTKKSLFYNKYSIQHKNSWNQEMNLKTIKS